MPFYDDIADTYDEMTGGAERGPAAAELAAEITRCYGIRSALDVACGTGLHAVALAKLGVRTVGSDISPAMLEKARARAYDWGVEVEWVAAAMQDLDDCIDGTFDAVLCLGNSLPHLLTDADLDAAISGFARACAPEGVVILHVLNYARILAARERIVHVSRRGGTEYVRFYDFLGERVRFNILELTWDGDTCRHALHSAEHRPYLADDLTGSLTRRGFTDITLFGDLQFAPLEQQTSPAVVVAARAPSRDG